MKKVKARKQNTFLMRTLAVITMLAIFVLSLLLVNVVKDSVNDVYADEKSYTPAIAVDFSDGINKDGLVNKGATFDETTGSAVFDGNGYMYFQPDVSDDIKDSFTVTLGAYLKSQSTAGYIFNTGIYANGVAVELAYGNVNFYFGNSGDLSFTLKNVLSKEEKLYLITIGYDKENAKLFYRLQDGTDLMSEKCGSSVTTSSVSFAHASYSLTLGAQSRFGEDTVNNAICKIKSFNVYKEFINDEAFIDATFNKLAGIEEPTEPSEPVIPKEPTEPTEPTESVTPSEPTEPSEEVKDEKMSLTTEILIMVGCLVWLTIFGCLVTRLVIVDETKSKVITSIILGAMAVAYFVALYFILGLVIV